MTLLFAVAAALSFAFGTFFTKGVTLRISVFKAIGPLFLLNVLFALPLIGLGPKWILWRGSIPYLHIIGAFSSGLAALIIFSMVRRSTASVVSIGQALSPAVVLVSAPIFLNSSTNAMQILAVIFLIFATVFPLRKSLEGVKSSTTVILMIIVGITSGAVTIVVALLYHQGVGMPETFIARQTIAGIVFILIFPPTGLRLHDFWDLARRSFFMSMGWMTSIYAIQRGSPIVVQSFLATIPIWVILIETAVYAKTPEKATIFSAFAATIGILVLTL